MEIFLAWIIFSFVAGYVGDSRKLGFWSAFLLSIFLSPLVGLIIAFASDKKVAIKQISPAQAKLINEGDKLLKDGKTNEAIEIFTSALTYSDKSPNTNFKLAKLYSLKQDGDNALKHLAKAVQDGFNNFEIMNNDSSLSYLRSMPDYKVFATNGYKMPTVQVEVVKPLSRIEELEKLNALLEKGVLTKEEFESEKKKILST